MPLISTMTGSETVADGFAKVFAFHVTREAETFIGQAAKTGEKVRAVGSPVRESAVAGIRQEIGGSWVMQSFEVEDDEIIKVFAQRRNAWNKLIVAAQLLLLCRTTGPLTRITIPLLNRPGKSRFTEAVMQGRFEVVTPQEAFERHGITVPPHFMRFYHPSSQQSVFNVTQVEAASSVKQKIVATITKADDGATVVVRSVKRRRAFEL
jgi:hypothetical protein